VTQAPATLADVARIAGVSSMTVSKVVNNRPGVSQETRKRILEVVERTGYVAHLSARGLKGGRINLLGVVVADLSTQYPTEIVRGASDAATAAGRGLALFTTGFDTERERQSVSMLTGGLAAGLLIVLPQNPVDYSKAWGRSPAPVVLLGHRGETHLPSVSADNYRGARLATEHLLGLGHTRIGFIAGNPYSGQSSERFQGYREALLSAGIPYDAALIRPGDYTQKRGFQAAHELLALPEAPSAIFAANDYSAFGAMDAVKDHNLRVPEDISVIGFDDIPMAQQVHPNLTTIHHPLHDMGAVATKLLISLVDGETPLVPNVELPSKLVVRASTASALSRR